jgi:hypothetical protein|tara:strand:+ start:3644 stop:4084 length:441 start_codon:yes stop_codon:yes gene_type:complete
MVYDVSGKESEWNEANFKSKRLHDIQELINYLRMNPLGMTEGKWNYELILKNIETLYGEGRSKYKSTEKKELDDLKDFINKTLKLMPPFIIVKKQNLTDKKPSVTFNEKNFEILMNLLYDFEMRVKDYNDDHGLTTKNKGTSGLFG